MNSKNIYLAVDLGAGSGRVLAGSYEGGKIHLTEINRFENTPVELSTGYHWNLDELFENIITGLTLAAKKYGDRIASIGIDTWGVDYGLIDKEGNLLNQPYQYRDSRTDGMIQEAFDVLPKKDIYEATGIQTMFFNTLYQIMAEAKSETSKIDQAEDLLFMPDLLGFMLTGKRAQERTIASTSQIYNPRKQAWDEDIIEKLGLPKKLFKDVSDTGSILGPLSESIAAKTGLKDVVVVSVAGHDTGSAVAGVPSKAEHPIFLSSGTWSLMGIELAQPVITKQSFTDDFTNEIGVNNTVRFLKNISGLWLIQESRRFWKSQGEDVEYSEMAGLAQEAEPFRSLINPDDESFATPGEMPRKIQDYCWNTRQHIPETKGQIIRCIYESLALRYSSVWKKLLQYTDANPPVLNIVGGGSQDKLLNQFTANAIGAPVIAGPTEATGLGNILVQMMANQAISSLTDGREIVAASFEFETYKPQDAEIWRNARETFNSVQHIHPNL
ncbi:MAG: rhamnulokinase [Opitutales bacterium]